MPQLLIKDGTFPLNVQCLFDLNLNFEAAESKIVKHSVSQEPRQALDMTAGACKHVKTCPTRGAHEHAYKGGEWSQD